MYNYGKLRDSLDEALYAINRAIGVTEDAEMPNTMAGLIEIRDEIWTQITTLDPSRMD